MTIDKTVTYAFKSPVKQKMLDRIKKAFTDNPKNGNFHIWYYAIYKLSTDHNTLPQYLQAIQKKYDELGLQSIEQLTLVEASSEPK